MGWDHSGESRGTTQGVQLLGQRSQHFCWAQCCNSVSVLQLLCEEWASYGVFYKYQPIDLVR